MGGGPGIYTLWEGTSRAPSPPQKQKARFNSGKFHGNPTFLNLLFVRETSELLSHETEFGCILRRY